MRKISAVSLAICIVGGCATTITVPPVAQAPVAQADGIAEESDRGGIELNMPVIAMGLDTRDALICREYRRPGSAVKRERCQTLAEWNAEIEEGNARSVAAFEGDLIH